MTTKRNASKRGAGLFVFVLLASVLTLTGCDFVTDQRVRDLHGSVNRLNANIAWYQNEVARLQHIVDTKSFDFRAFRAGTIVIFGALLAMVVFHGVYTDKVSNRHEAQITPLQVELRKAQNENRGHGVTITRLERNQAQNRKRELTEKEKLRSKCLALERELNSARQAVIDEEGKTDNRISELRADFYDEKVDLELELDAFRAQRDAVDPKRVQIRRWAGLISEAAKIGEDEADMLRACMRAEFVPGADRAPSNGVALADQLATSERW